MKIKKIILYNIGPYVDRNVFNLTSNDERNIVLIGGKNGSGKTTFFKSIKTCLYGCRVWGFEAPGKEYYSIIENLLNAKLQYDVSARGYVEVELFFDDGKKTETYRLHREWEKKKKSIEETFLIYKDESLLDEESNLNFINYLLSVIPPDMFNFYFFDGESIADFFLGNNGGKNFKNAFLKLYGLDTLSLMVENFERYFKKGDGNDSAYLFYQTAKNKMLSYEQEIEAMKADLREVENQLDLYQIKLQALQKEYTRNGGVSLSEWKEIHAALAKEETKREEINRWLKEVANRYLPFLIIRTQMKELLHRLEQEQNSKNKQAIEEAVQDANILKSLCNFLAEKGIDEVSADEIIRFFCSLFNSYDCKEILFDLSNAQINKLIAQIYEEIEFDQTLIPKATRTLTTSLRHTKILREKLTSSSIDGYEEFASKKEEFDHKILALKLKVEKMTQEISLREVERIQVIFEYNKSKELYEKQLKSKSISELSSRAIGAYTLLEEELIARQGKILQEAFIECFTSIINKENFIDGIVIDKNINVIPYKYVDVTFLQIENYLKSNEKTHFLELFDRRYLIEINKLRLGKKKVISLPSPITAPFSQGERQVYIMSLYLALLKTSRKDIPFFMDTPLARIDSNHREKIVKEFFKKISNQMFILSTDEEIVGKYKELIEDKISDCFTLAINDYGKTSVVPAKYFGE